MVISATLDYITQRLERLAEPFELRTAFSRQGFTQLLMMEGKAPAAAVRLEHEDVEAIRNYMLLRSRSTSPQSRLLALPRR